MSKREWHCDGPEGADYTSQAMEALRCLEGKWKMIILSRLFARPVWRFSELERSVPGISQKMLIQQLKEMAADGLVQRKAYPEVPPRVEYALTDIGRALAPAMVALLDWAVLREGARQERRPVEAGSSVSP
jgi:DNA-binding HxlR family transcriptional regulator